MKVVTKTAVFLSLITLLFSLLRAYSDYEQVIWLADLEDIGGVPWLYSAVCLICGSGRINSLRTPKRSRGPRCGIIFTLRLQKSGGKKWEEESGIAGKPC